MHDTGGNQGVIGPAGAGLLLAALAGAGCDDTLLSRPGEEVEREPGIGYLMVNVKGQGAVLSADAQIDCGDDCHGTYSAGTVVPLVTLPEPGWHFQRFDGDLECASGRVPVDFERRCVAVFERDDNRLPSLELVVYGAGTVTLPDVARQPGCDEHCIFAFPPGTELRLETIASLGARLSRITGHVDCEDGLVRLDGHRRCVAVFAEDPEQLAEVWLDVSGRGRLSLGAADPATRARLPEFAPCETPCLRRIPLGGQRTLIATEDPPARFSHFEGDPDCEDGVITPRQGLHCRAVFSDGRVPLTVRFVGGEGRIRIWERGQWATLGCGYGQPDGSRGCTHYASRHASAVIEPRPGDHRVWYSGDCTGPNVVFDRPRACQVLMDRPRPADCKGPDEDGSPPDAPLAITASVPDCDRVELRWEVQSSHAANLTHCDVERFELRRDGQVLAPRLAARSYTDAARFDRSAAHRYAITPIDAAGNRGAPTELEVLVPACRPERIRVLALLAQIPDRPAGSPSRAEIIARLQGDTDSAQSIWRGFTQRNVEIETLATSWAVLPGGWERYCGEPGGPCGADRIVADYLDTFGAGLPAGPFDQVLLFVTGTTDAHVPFSVERGGETYAGFAFGSDAAVATPQRLARAVGRAFGAELASALSCPSGAAFPDPLADIHACFVAIGQDPIDLMGRGLDGLSAYNLERLGVLDASDRYVVDREATVRLRPVEERLRGGRQLVVPLDLAGPESFRYSVDLQRSPSFTEASWNAHRSGVTVRIVRPPGRERQESGTWLPPEWRPRPFSSFWDATNGVAIDVTELSETEATVRVRRGVFLPGAR